MRITSKYTIEEYLHKEEASEEKHQYYQGEIFTMSGAKVPHNIIAGNLYSELRQKLKGKSCRPFNSDQRIHIPENTLLPTLIFLSSAAKSLLRITMIGTFSTLIKTIQISIPVIEIYEGTKLTTSR